MQEKYGVNVPIVPVGFNYFRGHRFRGRVVVEFGSPINITKEVSDVYRESKRSGYQSLLQQVEDGMRSVIVTASDYNELKLIHAARRLYQHSSTGTPTKIKQDLARRFSMGYKLIREKYGDNNMPQDIKDIQVKLEAYLDKLDHWGLKDYQLINNDMEISFFKMLYIFVHGAVILILASIPSLILNAPVGTAAHIWSNREAKKDLKASRVKLAARDVLLSKKILFSLVAVPVLWVTYAILLLSFTSLEVRTVVVLFICCPLFSYLGVMAVEASMVDLKDLRPAFLRMLPAFREQAPEIHKMRVNLQKDVRQLVKKYGPELGAIYYDKTNAWEQAFRKSNISKLNMGQDISAEAAAAPLLNNIACLGQENDEGDHPEGAETEETTDKKDA